MPGSRFWVCALKVLQNSMMLRPRCPSAGPIGGDGLALPAGTCSLIIPTIFLAIPYSLGAIDDRAIRGPPASRRQESGAPIHSFLRRLSYFLDLGIFELHRGRPAEDRYRDLDPRL